MKHSAVLIFLFFSIELTCYGQLDFKVEDISDSLLVTMLKESDTTIEGRFQNYAVKLFMEGNEVEDSILKDESRSLIGVCLWSMNGFAKEPPTFNLYRVHYRDLREKNFHKSLYFGRGIEGFAEFFITWDYESEHEIILSAVDTFLYHDQLPIGNGAFEFARTHKLPNERYHASCDSRGTSFVIPSDAPCYLRQNGNFIILIKGFVEEDNFTEWEDLHPTSYFVSNLFSISILVIDPSKGTYGDVFKH
jgi:hypothetical protein